MCNVIFTWLVSCALPKFKFAIIEIIWSPENWWIDLKCWQVDETCPFAWQGKQRSRRKKSGLEAGTHPYSMYLDSKFAFFILWLLHWAQGERQGDWKVSGGYRWFSLIVQPSAGLFGASKNDQSTMTFDLYTAIPGVKQPFLKYCKSVRHAASIPCSIYSRNSGDRGRLYRNFNCQSFARVEIIKKAKTVGSESENAISLAAQEAVWGPPSRIDKDRLFAYNQKPLCKTSRHFFSLK